MNEHQVTSDDAFATIDSLVENEWKTINQARFEHRAILSTVKRVVNMAVSMRLYYVDRKDAYTFGTILEDVVNSVFLKPVAI
jgi:(-)-germacrene D synthase